MSEYPILDQVCKRKHIRLNNLRQKFSRRTYITIWNHELIVDSTVLDQVVVIFTSFCDICMTQIVGGALLRLIKNILKLSKAFLYFPVAMKWGSLCLCE